MSQGEGFRLLGKEEVESAVDRLAGAIHARLGRDIAWIGIRRRGAPLAERLASRWSDFAGVRTDLGEIELERYADDLTIVHERTRMTAPDLPFEVEGRTVVLVDDVLYTGRTILRAAAWLADSKVGRAYCAVLCSRGEVELPVEAAFCGMRLDVGEANLVEVHVPPYEDELAIWIRRRPEQAAEKHERDSAR